MDLDDPLWLGRPRLIAGEALSSWFARTAWANGLRPGDLHAVVQPGAYRYPPDLDRHAEPLLLHALADRTDHPPSILKDATLTRWQGALYETDDGISKLPWLPAAGTHDSRRSYGQQFCPACLDEDSTPHFRLCWRLAFVVACPRHRVLMADRCALCAMPVNVLRGEASSCVRCWHCGGDYRRIESEPASDRILDLQDRLERVLDARWFPLVPTEPLYGIAFFRVLTLLFRLLSAGRHARPLATWLASQEPAFIGLSQIPRVREVELLNPRCRRDVLLMASHLLEEWPHRFVAACRATRISSRHLIKTGCSYPFVFQDAVDRYLSVKHRTPQADEIEAAKRVLRSRRVKPTYRALVELTGVRIDPGRAQPEAARDAIAWGEGRYWKLDGVSPEVKAAARLAARRAGENVGPWLDNILRKALAMPPRDDFIIRMGVRPKSGTIGGGAAV